MNTNPSEESLKKQSCLRFPCPWNRVNIIDRSKELYYIKLQQMSVRKEDTESYEESSEDDMISTNDSDSSESSRCLYIDSFEKNPKVQKHEFFRMLRDPDSIDSIQFFGRYEESPSCESPFVPPHLARYNFSNECYSYF
ncbi:uncharacterized protein [Blastocystis hominis]|uniref:Uncharacterized protein n=1 Tax=Blastocystis hominis TaxID=12968 RepID=D8M0K5_BLAHO|nr:uncharacterized protein [Blastocystis hominis]CBK21594.2 unnamed protein product [Blastocystis hominis]|eukprot:XP_012895642.1 uncharacterized protein [Blastocystis hominis]